MNTYVTGNTIRQLRESRKLTQAELAARIGVSSKTISKWETGKGLPDISLLQPLAQALGISVIELMNGEHITNRNIAANMLRCKFYVCPVCGNVMHSMGNAVVSFLVYGLDKEWFLSHPDLEKLTKKQQLALYMENGALVIHAHPFRESGHIDHIRLFPRSVQGIEIINANRTDFENEMAKQYADNYGFFYFAGTDNHVGGAQKKFAGMESDTPIVDENDFIERVRASKMQVFAWTREE